MRRHNVILLEILRMIEESQHNLDRSMIIADIRRHNSNISDGLINHHRLLLEEMDFISFFNGQGYRLTHQGHDYLELNRSEAEAAKSNLKYISV